MKDAPKADLGGAAQSHAGFDSHQPTGLLCKSLHPCNTAPPRLGFCPLQQQEGKTRPCALPAAGILSGSLLPLSISRQFVLLLTEPCFWLCRLVGGSKLLHFGVPRLSGLLHVLESRVYFSCARAIEISDAGRSRIANRLTSQAGSERDWM